MSIIKNFANLRCAGTWWIWRWVSYRCGIREDCILTGCRYHHATLGLLIGGIDFKQFAVTLRDGRGISLLL